jgi:class 3 adenylate cyclase/tetratricopeptide (TPR) repeat protein
MRCPQCGHENATGTKFCGECGSRLAARCGACGAANPSNNKFCGECGASIAPNIGGRKAASPESYTPKHLAEKILTSKAALEGERKQVTVLFADLKGSMELLADRDPEEARELLDPVLERMMEAVHHYEGTVNQVMGDGIMALFGAPIGHEDHAVRACYAALRMQRRVALYADELQRGGGTPVQIRVGLNSGEVVVRAIGSDLHMDYTAVGQTTHLAARMEQMAKPGSVLVTADTLRLAEGYVQVRPLGSISVKGLETPIPVYELSGIVPARSRFQASAARGLTRFVGRDSEMQQLGQVLERAAAGHGQVVAVVGDAGVGKSRLAWEFTRSHRTHGWLVLESGSVSYGKATPYLPVIELVKAYCRIQERDDPREIRERVAGKLLTLDRTLEPLLTPLLALLDVAVDDATWGALDPPQRRQRTLEAVKRLLLRESQVQPLLVIFEDLHWIDAETQALLDGLIESLPTARVLLLVNYRPEYQHAWGGKSYYLQLRIDPLPPESAEELLTALLGQDQTLEPLKRVLIARTEGNPFFLEESVQTLVETRVLVGKRGAYRMTKAPDAWQIPATAQAILAARIDRLSTADKRLLQTASVIGKDVPFALLHAVADVPEDSLRLGLAHLQAAEFLYETTLFPDLEYTFKHALTHEVAYGGVLQDRRRPLHARIVDAIEMLYPERLTEQVERLAHHAVRGERWEKAVTHLRQAGAKAFARSTNREAVVCFEHALAALKHLPETREALEQAVDLHFDLRTALFPLGEFERIAEYLREAESLVRALGDERRLGRLSVYMCQHLWVTGHPVEALRFGQSARAIAERLGDFPLTVGGSLYLGVACFGAGDHRQAEELLKKVLQLLEGDVHRERLGLAGFPAVMARLYLSWMLADCGRFDEALRHGREGIRHAEAVDQPYSLGVVCWGLAYLYIVRGELGEATRLVERALALSREWNLVVLPLYTAGLGYVHALSGRTTEGISLLKQGVSGIERMGFGSVLTPSIVWLGEANVLAARIDDGLALGEQALTLARERGQRGAEAWARRLLGEIALHRDPLDAEMAEEHYHLAMALAEELGMRPLVAHCHLGLGRLYQRTGDRPKAQEHLTTAATMYRGMNMGFWLAQVEAALSPGDPARGGPSCKRA